jgi:hypothetical protein
MLLYYYLSFYGHGHGGTISSGMWHLPPDGPVTLFLYGTNRLNGGRFKITVTFINFSSPPYAEFGLVDKAGIASHISRNVATV